MSTRTQIRFVQGDSDRAAQVYKHSDGYPSNIVPLLETLYELARETGTIRGPDYAAAQFIFIDKLRSMGNIYVTEVTADGQEVRRDEEGEPYVWKRGDNDYDIEVDGVGLGSRDPEPVESPLELFDPETLKGLSQPSFLLGHGVEEVGPTHGDEEYIYVVDIGERPDDPYADRPEWTVKISGHASFPRLGEGEDADQFDESSWAYDGPVTEVAALIRDEA